MAENHQALGLRVLVVGASSGIGRALTLQLAGRGARVVACARRRERIDAAPGVVALGCDVTDARQCETVVNEANQELGGLDALVYCAGLSQITPLDRSGVEEWHQLFATNMFGAAMIARAALPHLCSAQSAGRALFLTSDSADLAYPGLVAYAASKAALGRFCQGLAFEFPQLKVSEVIVGPTANTEVADHFDPAEFEKWLTRWFEEGFVRYALQQPEQVATRIIEALLTENPPARLDLAGPTEASPTPIEG
jgi:NAD(P)-dependent dehydrogenase (short-subunit alcohol dehydrogenase family)